MKYNRYPKRDAVKNYFPLPNEIFSLGLSGGEILVYTYLMYREDRKTFQCHPSYKTIGEAVGMSKNTVKKYVDGLVEKRLLTTEPTTVITQKGEKRNGNLLYWRNMTDNTLRWPCKRRHQKKQVKVRGHPAPPTSDGRADRWGILRKSQCLCYGVLQKGNKNGRKNK